MWLFNLLAAVICGMTLLALLLALAGLAMESYRYRQAGLYHCYTCGKDYQGSWRESVQWAMDHDCSAR